MSGEAPRLRPRVVRPDSVPWEDLGAGGELAEIRALIGPEHSDTMGAGICRFRNTRFDWRLTYDECIHVLEGAMEVHCDGDVLRAGAGDVLFLPRGIDVVYAFPERCVLFYAAYPVDWQDRLEPVDG